MKKLLLFLLSLTISCGLIYANKIGFSLQKKGENRFVHHLSLDGRIGLAHFCTSNYELYVGCHNNEEKEQALIVLKRLVNDLIEEGFVDCMIKDLKTNEYIRFDKRKKPDGYITFVNLYITFREKPITELQVWADKK